MPGIVRGELRRYPIAAQSLTREPVCQAPPPMLFPAVDFMSWYDKFSHQATDFKRTGSTWLRASCVVVDSNVLE